jgi:1,4-dihydroxy-2-naphthoate octaprenyltransferase
LGALLLQIGSNFANDYFDYFKGADTQARPGPLRAVAGGFCTWSQ